MKKHNEGYTLPLVMVVMVILCLAAVSIMSVALRNLKAQQASVQRMQDQYVAAGMIEKVVAQLESIEVGKYISLLEIYDNSKPENTDAQLTILFSDENQNHEDGTYNYYTADNSKILELKNKFVVKLVAVYGEVQVSCELMLECNFKINGPNGGLYEIFVSAPIVTYLSYEVDYITTSETGGGQE